MKIEKLFKYYGNKIGIENISFVLQEGHILGVLGHNGSGKSTLFKTILGLIPKNSGEILLENKKIGYVPENRSLFQDVRTIDYLKLIANLHGVKKDVFEKNLGHLVSLFKNEENLYKKIHTLSKGNQQKVQFMGALIHNPDIIILDEPMSGLDITNINLMKSIITALKEKGKEIILSSHQYDDIEMFCDEIIILKQGKVIIHGNIQTLKDAYPHRYLSISDDVYGKYKDEEGVLECNTLGSISRYRVDGEANMRKILLRLMKHRNNSTVKVESISIKDLVEHSYENIS